MGFAVKGLRDVLGFRGWGSQGRFRLLGLGVSGKFSGVGVGGLKEFFGIRGWGARVAWVVVRVREVFGKVDIRLHGKGDSNSHGAKPVHHNHVADKVDSDQQVVNKDLSLSAGFGAGGHVAHGWSAWMGELSGASTAIDPNMPAGGRAYICVL